MDFEQASIRLPTLKEFNNKIKEIIDEKVKKSRMELMESIAEGENISLKYLMTKYGGEESSPPLKEDFIPIDPLLKGLEESEALLWETHSRGELFTPLTP